MDDLTYGMLLFFVSVYLFGVGFELKSYLRCTTREGDSIGDCLLAFGLAVLWPLIIVIDVVAYFTEWFSRDKES